MKQNCLRVLCCEALIFWFWDRRGDSVVSLRKHKQELKCLSSGYGFSRPLLLIRGGGALVAIKEVKVENYS